VKRLLELPADDRLTARAHTLVRAVGSTVESEERMLRIRRALDAERPQAAPRWALRFAFAAALVGASAAAAAGGGALSTLWAPSESATGPLRVVTPPAVHLKAPSVQQPAHAPEPVASQGNPAAPAASAPRAVGARLAPATGGSDVARVHEAAIALRHDGDPTRALQLLEGSSKPISGPLAEEALALRIEASTARHDGNQAKLAAAYLARYPNGRYRDLANKALAGHVP
jgi:hypothetical protein